MRRRTAITCRVPALPILPVLLLLAACTSRTAADSMPRRLRYPDSPHYSIAGIHKIKHVVLIMQENRSFDSYFGTFPGADGIPRGVCLPAGHAGPCVRPYPDHADVNDGGPHGHQAFAEDYHRGRMNGFVASARREFRKCRAGHIPGCVGNTGKDVMGYHTGSDIPNYWAYAKAFVLQDHMFESTTAWSPSDRWRVSSTPPRPGRCPRSAG